MKKKSQKKVDEELTQNLFTTDTTDINNNFKDKLKKIIIPTIVILIAMSVAIILVFILNNN